MKKLFLIIVFMGLKLGVNAQMDKLMLQAYKEAKEKSDKEILNEKTKTKAKTWLARASTYEDIAMNPGSIGLDSNAANVVIEAYKKAIELDTKDGKEGSIAKEAKKMMSGERLRISLIQLGAVHYSAKNFKKSQDFFRSASNLFPNDTLAHNYYGVASQILKDDASMVQGYERFLNLGGNEPSIYAAIYQYYIDKGEVDKGMAVLNKGIERNKKLPVYKDLIAVKTNYFISKKMYKEALVAFEEIAANDPKNDQVLVNIGIIYDNKAQEIKDKINSLTKSLPNSKSIEDALKSKTLLVDDYNNEIKRIKDNMKKQPKRMAEFKKSLAQNEESLKKVKAEIDELNAKKAEEEGKKAFAQKTMDEIAILKKEREVNTNKAISSYEKAVAINPQSYDALYNMGVIKFNEGVEIKKPYDDLNPNSTEYKTNGAAIKEAFEGKFKSALGFFEKAFAIRNDEGALVETLKNTYRLLGMQDKYDALNK